MQNGHTLQDVEKPQTTEIPTTSSQKLTTEKIWDAKPRQTPPGRDRNLQRVVKSQGDTNRLASPLC